MYFLIGYFICVALALANLPFVLQEGGSMPNLISMIFCSALALYNLVMALKTSSR
jgi:hypothetical protein